MAAVTVADVVALIDAIPAALIPAVSALIAPLASILVRSRDLASADDAPADDGLTAGDLSAVLALLPVVTGLGWRTEACRERVVARWFSAAAQRAETLAVIAATHRYGHCFFDGEGDGLWVPSRLLSWLPDVLLPSGPTRWKLAAEFPVPVQQRLASCPLPPLLPAGGGDVRPALTAGTLSELRLAAAPWAARFAWSGQAVRDILAIGGFDGLSAAALLLHRGSAAADGWQEARGACGLPHHPGWAGAVLAQCGRPFAGQVQPHQLSHAWLSADFEEADSRRSSSTASPLASQRTAASARG